MAKIGLKFPCAAIITGYDSNGMPEHGEGGFIIGKAITAELSYESNDNPLFADDSISENDVSFSGGTIKLGVSEFGGSYSEGLNIQAKMLGHKILLKGHIKRSATDVAPYLSFGFYKTKKQNGKLFYEAILLYKTIFKIPADSTNTKGKSIEWQTPEIEGSILSLDGYDESGYSEIKVFETEMAARSWLQLQLGIAPVGDKLRLMSRISELKRLDPERYTSASWGEFYYEVLNIENYAFASSNMTEQEIDYYTEKLSEANSNLVERSK